MEIDSPSSSSSGDENLPPSDRIMQRLALIGAPDEYFEDLPSGLVALARDNKACLPDLVSAILPTETEVAQVIDESKAKSSRSLLSPSLKVLFHESMDLLQWLMFEGEPLKALNSISLSVGEHGVCGAVWGKDDVAFRCRTCELDPTCAICVPCFQNGNHKSHDYSIIYTNGGCCDCGDETAWKPEGFCSKHRGAGTLEPLPDDIVKSLGPVLDCLFSCWKSKLIAAETQLSDSTKSSHYAVELRMLADELTFAIIEMLLDFCKYSESLLSFISRRVIAVAGLLDMLVQAESYMTEAVMEKLHELLFKLLGDSIFKLEFAKVFVNHYPFFVNEAIEASSGTVVRRPTLYTFSVQIFTVPTLTMRLVKEVNLFVVLIECLGNIFLSYSGEDGLLQLSNWANMFDVTLRVIEDIKFVVSHQEVAEYVTSEQQHIFKVWLRVISCIQGMNPQKRETGAHIEEENDYIHIPFYLCSSIASINSLLVAAAFSKATVKQTIDTCRRDLDNELGQRQAKVGRASHESHAGASSGAHEGKNVLQDSEDLSSYISLASECLRCIDQWFRLDGTSSASNAIALGSNANFSFKKALSRVQGTCSFKLYDKYRSTALQIQQCKGADNQMPMGVENSKDIAVDDNSKLGQYSTPESGPLLFLGVSEWRTISYNVHSQKVSVHLPLHGLISIILQEALRKFYGESLLPYTSPPGLLDPSSSDKQYFFGTILQGCKPFGFSSFMMEHPLRVRVFCAQVRAGMWKRNGDNALLSSEYYHSAHWSALKLELDLFLLQICAALAPPDLYVRRILERFGLLNYLSLDEELSSEYEPVLVKEMLTLIIQIVKERRYCGFTTFENLQRELVCKLSTGDATRSQLQKSLPSDLSKLNQLQEVLDRIGEYSHPSGMKQGRYTLRFAYWKELDLYHLRWNPRDLQNAEEKYLSVCGVSALTTQLPKWTKIYPPLSSIGRIATCRMGVEIVRAVIFYAVSDKSAQSRAPDGVLIAGLHFLALGLDICSVQRESSQKFERKHEEPIPLLSFAREEINTDSLNGSHRQSLLSLLVSLMRMCKNDNVSSFMEAGNLKLSSLVETLLKKFAELDDECKSKLNQLAPDVFSYLVPPSQNNENAGLASTAEKVKSKARERQAAILAKMRAQQSKFLESVKTVAESELDGPGKEEQISSAEEDLVDNEIEVCSLCRDTCSKDPVSFLVLLQKSSLVSFVNKGPPLWDQDLQSGKAKGIVIADTMTELSGEEAVEKASSKKVMPSFQLTQLVQEAVREFAQGGHPLEVLALTDYLKAYIPELKSKSVPSVMREKTVYSLESLEQNLFTSTQNVMAIPVSDTVMMEDGETSSAKDTKGVGMDTILLGKYIASLTREPSEISSASKDSSICKKSAPMHYDGFGPSGCDGIHLSSCGHAVHQRCLDRYVSSLKDRYSRRLIFEGGDIVDPNQGEFLCPVCRCLVNSSLPADNGYFRKHWMKHLSRNNADRICSLAAPDQQNRFRLQEALLLLKSVSAIISKGELVEALPIKNRRMLPDLEPLLKVLQGLYFPEEKDFLASAGRVSPSLIMWDTFKYSLVSTEIAARNASKTTSTDTGLSSLYGELSSSGELMMSVLLRLVHSTRSKNSLDMLLRFRGIRLFAASICRDPCSNNKSSTVTQRREGLLQILQHIDAGVSFPDIQFWSRASDPVLARDPFSTLMWILFCLPHPFASHQESFLCLVHMLYSVSIIQGIVGYYVKHGQTTINLGFDNRLATDFSKLVAESATAQQYFLSNYVNPSSDFEDTVHSLSLPFLRQCALLWKILCSSGLMASDTGCGIDSCSFEGDEVSQLHSMFQIPSLDLILADMSLWSLGIEWFHHFQESSGHLSVQSPLYLTPVVPFQLMCLPSIYQDLLQRYIKPRCPDCKEVQHEPALCLLCGRLCSADWKLCCRESGCQRHVKSCGSGTGVFLLMRRTTILLQRNARRALWPSPYLDAFGEEDSDMLRGKPLYLNEERYSSLTYMVASHGLERNSGVLRQTTVNTVYLV